jgi:hypothetical protein
MNGRGVRRVCLGALVTFQIVSSGACSVTERVTLPANEMPVAPDFRIATVRLTNGQIITFDGDGGMYIEKPMDGKPHRMIAGTTKGTMIEIEPENASVVNFERSKSSGMGSFLAGIGVGLPVGAALFYLIVVSLSGH